MATFHELTTAQLRQALQLREQIEALEQKLSAILGAKGSSPTVKAKAAVRRSSGKRAVSSEARTKLSATAKARRQESEATAPLTERVAKAPQKKSGLTDEGRAKLAAAMKARWAARKKGAPAPNAPVA